jgi:hypothetical protein
MRCRGPPSGPKPPDPRTRGDATIFIVVIYAMMVMMTLGVLAWFVLNEGD